MENTHYQPKHTKIWSKNLLEEHKLKDWLHRDLSSQDKIMLVLATFQHPAQIKDLETRAKAAGFRVPNSWNISSILSRSQGAAIRVPAGWELTEKGKSQLNSLGAASPNPAATRVAADLRKHLDQIKDGTTRAFVEEAIKCYEARLYRSAVVMSWIAAMDVLHREVAHHHLASFNAEAKKFNNNWKRAANQDGIARMPEGDFLDRLVPIGIIGKNVKEELAKALKLRNACGHPNSLQVGPNMVAGHIETLILNVFEKFDA